MGTRAIILAMLFLSAVLMGCMTYERAAMASNTGAQTAINGKTGDADSKGRQLPNVTPKAPEPAATKDPSPLDVYLDGPADNAVDIMPKSPPKPPKPAPKKSEGVKGVASVCPRFSEVVDDKTKIKQFGTDLGASLSFAFKDGSSLSLFVSEYGGWKSKRGHLTVQEGDERTIESNRDTDYTLNFFACGGEWFSPKYHLSQVFAAFDRQEVSSFSDNERRVIRPGRPDMRIRTKNDSLAMTDTGVGMFEFGTGDTLKAKEKPISFNLLGFLRYIDGKERYTLHNVTSGETKRGMETWYETTWGFGLGFHSQPFSAVAGNWVSNEPHRDHYDNKHPDHWAGGFAFNIQDFGGGLWTRYTNHRTTGQDPRQDEWHIGCAFSVPIIGKLDDAYTHSLTLKMGKNDFLSTGNTVGYYVLPPIMVPNTITLSADYGSNFGDGGRSHWITVGYAGDWYDLGMSSEKGSALFGLYLFQQENMKEVTQIGGMLVFGWAF